MNTHGARGTEPIWSLTRRPPTKPGPSNLWHHIGIRTVPCKNITRSHVLYCIVSPFGEKTHGRTQIKQVVVFSRLRVFGSPRFECPWSSNRIRGCGGSRVQLYEVAEETPMGSHLILVGLKGRSERFFVWLLHGAMSLGQMMVIYRYNSLIDYSCFFEWVMLFSFYSVILCVV